MIGMEGMSRPRERVKSKCNVFAININAPSKSGELSREREKGRWRIRYLISICLKDFAKNRCKTEIVNYLPRGRKQYANLFLSFFLVPFFICFSLGYLPV